MIGWINLARLICLLLSLFGSAVFVKNRLKVSYAFSLSVVCSSIIVLLFLASLVMPITVWVWIFFGLGLCFLLYSIIRRELHVPDIFNLTNLFLVVGLAAVIIFLAGRRFVFIDDYTHWAVIARTVVETHALPTANDFLISFTSYVPGSALWIGFVVNVIGGVSEDTYLIAQAFLILLFFAPLTGVGALWKGGLSRGKGLALRFAMLILVMVLCAVTMSFCASICSLAVDGVLVASAISGICFVFMADVPLYKKTWLSIPLMLACILIKTTGILYACSVFLVLIYLMVKERRAARRAERINISANNVGAPGQNGEACINSAGAGGRNTGGQTRSSGGRRKNIIAIIAIPICAALTMLFWTLHVHAAFPDASSSMHSLSVSRWVEIFESHESGVVQETLSEFFRKVTLWYLVLFVIALVVLYVFIYVCGRKTGHRIARQSLWVLLLSMINYVVYLGGMLFVYLFSMPDYDAVRTAAFDRYMWVELLYLIGIFVCFLYTVFGKYESGFVSVAVPAGAASAVSASTAAAPAGTVPSVSDSGDSGSSDPKLNSVSTKAREFAIRHGFAIRLIPLIAADVLAVAFLILFWRHYDVYSVNYYGSPMQQVNELAGDDYTGDVVFYAPSQMEDDYDMSLLIYFGRYKFRSEAITVARFNEADLDYYLSNFSHIYFYEVDDQLRQYLHERGWEGDIEPGLYETREFAAS